MRQEGPAAHPTGQFVLFDYLTSRVTLKRAGTYSSTSETSSPSGRSEPRQSGQDSCRGAIVSTSRGNSAGSGRRAGFLTAFSFTAMVAGCVGNGSAAWFVFRSSSRSSRCSISAFSFSDAYVSGTIALDGPLTSRDQVRCGRVGRANHYRLNRLACSRSFEVRLENPERNRNGRKKRSGFS